MAKVARWTLVYYAATTVTAVVLGMVLVTVLNPGRGSPLDGDVANCAGAQVLPIAWYYYVSTTSGLMFRV